MRVDGRQPDEFRSVVVKPDFSAYAEGSALFEIGDTKILCNVSIEEGIPRWLDEEKKAGGWITLD